jgi:hypothetical protein
LQTILVYQRFSSNMKSCSKVMSIQRISWRWIISLEAAEIGRQ